jgi:hypothetical protein
LALPLFFLDTWVRQGLIKLVLLQVLVPDARRSHAPTTPERCRSAAVAKLPHQRIPFAFELAHFFSTR